MGVDDPYAAWCVDEAIAEYTLRIRRGQKPLPPKTTDNNVLIRKVQKGRMGRL